MSASTFYSVLPPSFQNAIITCYSFWLFDKKYNKESKDTLLDRATPEVKLAVEQSFHTFILDVVKNVPFYREHIKRLGVSVDEITLDNYKEIFPLITKDDVRKNPELFYSEDNSEGVAWLSTSGTSGSPLKIKSFLSGRRKNYDFYKLVLQQYGVTLFSESATFAGRVLFSKVINDCYWRRDYYLNTTYFSTYHMSDSSLPFYVAELERRKPQFIDSYPSSLAVLAKYITEAEIKLSFSPKLILTSSESLSDAVRGVISSAFNHAPVVDYYGCTEMAVMAYTEGDKYIFPPQYSLVEFMPIGNELSKIICTSLINRAMPLIRYDIGDVCYKGLVGANLQQECEKITGREDDLIKTPGGAKIGRMDPVFKGISGIDKAQIIQVSLHKLTVKVILLFQRENEFDKEKLIGNIKERVGPAMEVEIQVVEDIPLTKSGKFRSVISNI